jgi:hypothetical protein
MSFSASSEPIPPPDDDRQRRRGRRVALLILAFCAAPTVAAWLAYFVWQPQSRSNYGELIAPHPLPDPDLRGLDGAAFHLSQLRGKWVLLQIDSAACAEACRKKLVYMRQVRTALGREADRVERVWLIDDTAEPDPALLREHEGLKIARAAAGQLPIAPGYIYLVDPPGNLMMRFPEDPDGRKMLRDLARLLRVSRVG